MMLLGNLELPPARQPSPTQLHQMQQRQQLPLNGLETRCKQVRHVPISKVSSCHIAVEICRPLKSTHVETRLVALLNSRSLTFLLQLVSDSHTRKSLSIFPVSRSAKNYEFKQ